MLKIEGDNTGFVTNNTSSFHEHHHSVRYSQLMIARILIHTLPTQSIDGKATGQFRIHLTP